jgi:uncharacterized RDD family membrane protein YckC
MKCPKCDYLGFETGDRCKNCGYDFSLMSSGPSVADADIGSLPLFTLPGDEDDDEPLVKLPAAPRAPLAVRRTPETPRLRAVSRVPRHVPPEPVLVFPDEAAPPPDLPLRVMPPPAPGHPRPAPSGVPLDGVSSVGARAAAAAIDLLILLAIDAAVVYFTLRMAGLTPADWRLLPPAPLLTFLILLKLAYFVSFTAMGGQTIGKMALSLRVVTDDNEAVDAARAIRRTLAGAISSLVFGLGFLPAFIGPGRRALHDRVAHTRVIALRSA